MFRSCLSLYNIFNLVRKPSSSPTAIKYPFQPSFTCSGTPSTPFARIGKEYFMPSSIAIGKPSFSVDRQNTSAAARYKSTSRTKPGIITELNLFFSVTSAVIFSFKLPSPIIASMLFFSLLENVTKLRTRVNGSLGLSNLVTVTMKKIS